MSRHKASRSGCVAIDEIVQWMMEQRELRRQSDEIISEHMSEVDDAAATDLLAQLKSGVDQKLAELQLVLECAFNYDTVANRFHSNQGRELFASSRQFLDLADDYGRVFLAHCIIRISEESWAKESPLRPMSRRYEELLRTILTEQHKMGLLVTYNTLVEIVAQSELLKQYNECASLPLVWFSGVVAEQIRLTPGYRLSARIFAMAREQGLTAQEQLALCVFEQVAAVVPGLEPGKDLLELLGRIAHAIEQGARSIEEALSSIGLKPVSVDWQAGPGDEHSDPHDIAMCFDYVSEISARVFIEWLKSKAPDILSEVEQKVFFFDCDSPGGELRSLRECSAALDLSEDHISNARARYRAKLRKAAIDYHID